ncbi:RBBP9/YdeN family alpha/beta hydrolase [Pseudomonadota bacterium]
MKKVLLIHGFEGGSAENWQPWLESELISAGFVVLNIDLPDSHHPDFDESMSYLRNVSADLGSDDIVIGHSLGGYFALKLCEEKEFGSVILVAPAIGDLLPIKYYKKIWPMSDVEAVESVIAHGLDLSAVKAKKKVAFFGKADPLIPVKSSEILGQDWDIRILNKIGHLTSKKFEELRDAILELA